MSTSSTAATFTWTVNTLQRTVANGIVSNVHFAVNASDGTYSAEGYGDISLDAPERDAEIIAYADLTEATCIGWAKDKLGEENVAEMEAALQVKIDEQRTPVTGTGVPW